MMSVQNNLRIWVAVSKKLIDEYTYVAFYYTLSCLLYIIWDEKRESFCFILLV